MRRLCRHCKHAYAPDETETKLLGADSSKPLLLYKEIGCESCNFLGFKGRLAVVEVLKINAQIDELIAQRATRQELLAAAEAAGFRDLVDDAVRHVFAGTTSISEISRVVDLTTRVE